VTPAVSAVPARFAHHLAVFSDIGEPAQGFDVARAYQGSLEWGGYQPSRAPVKYLFYRHTGLIVTIRRQG
jgi:hypothetical protein